MNNDITKETFPLLALLNSSKDIKPLVREIHLLDTVLVVMYKAANSVFHILKEGTVLRMWRDRGNEYDNMAVVVYWNNTPIGWLPAEYGLIIARLMDAGKAFVCRVAKAEKYKEFMTDKMFIKVAVRISLID